MIISPNEPYFALQTSGDPGSIEVSIPSKSDAFLAYESKQTQKFKYKLSHLQHCMKALANSERTQIKVNQEGTVSIENGIRTEASMTFVEYFMVPEHISLEDEESSSSDDDEKMQSTESTSTNSTI